MQDLKVIGVEDGALVAANDDGERYRIVIDEVLQSRLRQFRTPAGPAGSKISPREIQQHIRSGLSAEDVAALTGAALEYVQRFEGPIIAERAHIVAQALAVAVRTGAEVDPLGETNTFGSVIRERLASLGASGERWASWKDAELGWMVKLEFTSDAIDHDARWSFEPRKNALAPANAEAATLSQQSDPQQGGLIPRLRAVAPLIPDETRFDSGTFDYVEAPAAESAPVPLRQIGTVVPAAINRAADDEPKDVQQTADLLEALRRRRGEREAAQLFDLEELDEGFDEFADAPGGESDFDEADGYDGTYESGVYEPGADEISDDEISDDDEIVAAPPLSARPAPVALKRVPSSEAPSGSASTVANQTGPLGARSGSRRGRASMPSWDEIVFGARSDDDTTA